MTEIQFHFNVPDRLQYACRLIRKALKRVDRIAVTAPQATLARFDRVLWSFEDLEFIPHIAVKRDQPPPSRLRETPVWLVEQASDAAHHDVLVHLGDEAVQGFESFGRLIEVVSTDAHEREAARARWRHYKTRGYAIEQHEAAA